MRIKDPNKKEAIFRAALSLVLEVGFSGLKISKVARAAKVATGTVYVYFNNKEELINQLYLELKKRSAQDYVKGLEEGQSFEDRFDIVWYNYLQRALEQPEEAAFLEQYYRSPYLDKGTLEATEELLLPIFSLLEEGQDQGKVKNLPVELLVAHLSGSLNELARWQHSGKISLGNTLKADARQLAWDSIKK